LDEKGDVRTRIGALSGELEAAREAEASQMLANSSRIVDLAAGCCGVERCKHVGEFGDEARPPDGAIGSFEAWGALLSERGEVLDVPLEDGHGSGELHEALVRVLAHGLVKKEPCAGGGGVRAAPNSN
jgi:hypothetical protein